MILENIMTTYDELVDFINPLYFLDLRFPRETLGHLKNEKCRELAGKDTQQHGSAAMRQRPDHVASWRLSLGCISVKRSHS